MHPGSRIQTDNPQGTERALLLAAIPVGVLSGLEDRLVGLRKRRVTQI